MNQRSGCVSVAWLRVSEPTCGRTTSVISGGRSDPITRASTKSGPTASSAHAQFGHEEPLKLGLIASRAVRNRTRVRSHYYLRCATAVICCRNEATSWFDWPAGLQGRGGAGRSAQGEAGRGEVGGREAGRLEQGDLFGRSAGAEI